jgi:hypothetical protein
MRSPRYACDRLIFIVSFTIQKTGQTTARSNKTNQLYFIFFKPAGGQFQFRLT